MKTPFLLTAGIALTLCAVARGDEGSSYSFIKTNSGKVYTNCRVYKTFPDGVIIEFENGGARLLFADLSPEFRAMLGYDPEKAAAFEKERAEKERKEQEERDKLAKHQSELARLQAAAFEAEAARYQFMSVQGGFGGYAGGGGYPYVGGYPFIGGYPYAGEYTWGYTFGDKRSAFDCHGYGGLLNSSDDYNCRIGIGSISYGNGYNSGNGYGFGPYRVGTVTRSGVNPSGWCRPNWGSNGWNGNGGWHGNTFHGHYPGHRASCGTPAANVIGRPHYNIPAPCLTLPATPTLGRSGSAGGGRGRR